MTLRMKIYSRYLKIGGEITAELLPQKTVCPGDQNLSHGFLRILCIMNDFQFRPTKYEFRNEFR